MNFGKQLKKSLAVTKKDLKVYYGRGPVIVFGLIMPAFLFLAFSLRRQIPFADLFPGLIGMALFFTVSSIGPIIAPWETRMKTFERLVSAPVSLWAIILGDVIASILFGSSITLTILLAGSLFLGFPLNIFYLILGTILAAFAFSSLGTLISSPPTDTPANIMMLATLIKFPLIFISGVFIPISRMGKFKVISFFSPLTYYVDLLKFLYQGEFYLNPVVNFLVLISFASVLFFLSVYLHKRNLSSRFSG